MTRLESPESFPLAPADDETAAETPRGYSLRHVLGHSAMYSVSDFALKLIGFFLVPVYTRAMTPADYGIIGYTTAVTQMLSPLLSLGLIGSMPMLYFAYQGRARAELISTVVHFTMLFAAGMTVLLTVLAPFSARIAPEVPVSYLIVALWALFFSTFYFLPLGLFNMEERPVAYSSYSIALSLFSVLVNILLVVVLRMGALGALLAALASGIAGFAVALWALRPYFRPVLDGEKLRAVLALSLPILPHLFSGTILKFADRLFVTNQVTLSATGIYSLAMTLASILPIALGGAYAAMNPLFLRRANAGDPQLPGDWARLCTLFAAATATLALGLTITGPYIVRWMTPVAYHTASGVMPILVLGQALAALYWLMSPPIAFSRRTWIYTAASMPAVALNLAMNAWLVPLYGETGAAWTMAVTSGVHLLIGAVLTYQYFRVPYQWAALAKLAVIVAAGWGVMALARPAAGGWGWAVDLLALGLVPAGLWLARFFERGEIDAAKRFGTELAQRFAWGRA